MFDAFSFSASLKVVLLCVQAVCCVSANPSFSVSTTLRRLSEWKAWCLREDRQPVWTTGPTEVMQYPTEEHTSTVAWIIKRLPQRTQRLCCAGCHLCGKYIPAEPQKLIFVLSEITIQKSICDIAHSVAYRCLLCIMFKNKQTSSIPCVSAIRNRCTFTSGPFMQIWSYRVLLHSWMARFVLVAQVVAFSRALLHFRL